MANGVKNHPQSHVPKFDNLKTFCPLYLCIPYIPYWFNSKLSWRWNQKNEGEEILNKPPSELCLGGYLKPNHFMKQSSSSSISVTYLRSKITIEYRGFFLKLCINQYSIDKSLLNCFLDGFDCSKCHNRLEHINVHVMSANDMKFYFHFLPVWIVTHGTSKISKFENFWLLLSLFTEIWPSEFDQVNNRFIFFWYCNITYISNFINFTIPRRFSTSSFDKNSPNRVHHIPPCFWLLSEKKLQD